MEKISEKAKKELDKLLEEKEIDFSAIQNICQYSSLSLQDFFEKVI